MNVSTVLPTLTLCFIVAVVFLLETLITIFALHGFWVGVTDHNSDLSSIVAAGVGGQELSPDPLWSFVALSPLTGIGRDFHQCSDLFTI